MGKNRIQNKREAGNVIELLETEKPLKRNWPIYHKYIRVRASEHKTILPGKVDGLMKDPKRMIYFFVDIKSKQG